MLRRYREEDAGGRRNHLEETIGVIHVGNGACRPIDRRH
jgi:hypothetical protein